MSYSRQDIQSIIARNKKKNTSKSPSPPFNPKSKQSTRQTSPKDTALRYQELYGKYKQLLEQVKDKNQKFQLQQIELQRLRLQRERDQKQLFRLRSMIGFIKKQDKGLQVNIEMQSGGSWSTGIQKSMSKQMQKDSDWSTPIKNYESAKLIRKLSPNNKEMNKTVNNKVTFRVQNNNQKQIQSSFYQSKTQHIYSPKNIQKKVEGFYKVKESKYGQSNLNKLSNSPYSKLRFSRKTGNLQ